MSEILLTEQASGVTPSAGKRTVYIRSDGLLRVKDSNGVETAIDTAVGIHAAVAKATPDDADEIGVTDSASAWGLKKLTWANLKTSIKTYLSGVAFPIGQVTPAAVAATTLSATGALTTVGIKEDIYGNVGIAINPSAWVGSGPGQNVLQGVSWSMSNDVNTSYLTNNVFYDGTSWKLIASKASVMQQMDASAGQIRWFAAGAATAGTTAPFQQIMTMTTGGLAVTGTVSATGALTSNGGLQLTGPIPTSPYMTAAISYENPITRYYIGDGTGYSWAFSKRSASVTTDLLTVTDSGNLTVVATTSAGAGHYFNKYTPQGGVISSFVSSTTGGDTLDIYSVSQFGYNLAACGIGVNANSLTGRTMNAKGTINASGADYAEYEHNNGLTFAKGDIVGFEADGTLTNVFLDAVRFAIKSTNPSYVGGDTWGNEDAVGKRPDEPQFTPNPYTGLQTPTEPSIPGSGMHMENGIEVADYVSVEDMDAYATAKSIYDASLRTYTMDMEQHAASVKVAKNLFDTDTYPEYLLAKAIFEAALETARQQVDRIAYSGKVPCNVLSATPGGYIVAMDADGAIAGQFVADPDFAQYKKAVGRVNRLLPDGRCEVAVIIH